MNPNVSRIEVSTIQQHVRLVVEKLDSGEVTASLYWAPEGHRGMDFCLCSAVSIRGEARVEVKPQMARVDLWIGSTSFRLPYSDLLAVARFLNLLVPRFPPSMASQSLPKYLRDEAAQ